MPNKLDELARVVVDTSFHIHNDLGPGLLESAYELILFEKLMARGLQVGRQVPVNIEYSGIKVEHAFKVDLLVERMLVVELKATESFAPVHAKQVLTYLKLMNLPLGLLINFGAPTFKTGVRRLANNHTDLAS
jgi:iron complex transport system substrate-binding protein